MKHRADQYCTLQHEDATEHTPWITAAEAIRDGEKVVEILQYEFPPLEEDWDEADRVIQERIALPIAAWATLVEMFCLRYPAAARHLITKAQGWLEQQEVTPPIP